ncbi:MAG TPA: NAD(P)/FAD-dependent oxidoreductase, partial [Chloroflexota bacterium]|nr:NAD(P)/FAD-dependent oxidoreductase [Chloroflexota bacterium]
MSASHYDVIVIGAGHNGLACACYLARAGARVLVLEMAEHVGGATHTAETVPEAPGHRFDTCSVVHNLIQMTSIQDELRLRDVGLEYVETDPFVTTFLPDGRSLRFYRSVERTCTEIAQFSGEDADAYARFLRWADPIVELSLASFRRSEDRRSMVREWSRQVGLLARTLTRRHPRTLASDLAGAYGPLLEATFRSEAARLGLVALAAHGTLGPQTPGAAFFVLFQAAYHRYGNWHARGGSGALATALRRRLEAWGGEVRTAARVERILTGAQGGVESVQLAEGERIAAKRVVAAINPQTALLSLLGEHHLPREMARRLQARHRSNAVQFVVHAALNRLPPWTDAPGDVWHGMQWMAESLDQVKHNFLEAEAGHAPAQPAVYIYTSSAIDSAVAPPEGHSAYIACPSYPARFADGSTWQARGRHEAARLLETVEARAPGFQASIKGVSWRHAADWEREIGLLGGHPMHLDITQDQVGPLRPLPELASHRTPVRGLYVSGAGTFPTG